MRCVFCQRKTKSETGIGEDCQKKYLPHYDHLSEDTKIKITKAGKNMQHLYRLYDLSRIVEIGTPARERMQSLLALAHKRVTIRLEKHGFSFELYKPFCKKPDYQDNWTRLGLWIPEKRCYSVALRNGQILHELLMKYYEGSYGFGPKGLFWLVNP